MVTAAQALAHIPDGLRTPLLVEYAAIVQHYSEGKWRPSELSGGLFCEIVFTILDGHAKASFAHAPSKPPNFVHACRNLENNAHVPRSFQILIPRMLPALYEVRNNRGVGHVGGEVDPNHMDATVVLGMVSWIMAELIRVFHSLGIDEAQRAVDLLVERRTPIVWRVGDVRRVLDPSVQLKDQILLLLASVVSPVDADDLFKWTGYENRGYFDRTLRSLHKGRMLELADDGASLQILPPGARRAHEFARKRAGIP